MSVPFIADGKLDSKLLLPVTMKRAGGGSTLSPRPPAMLELLSVFCSLVAC